ncbi:phage tail tape measure protein [Serratia marcescens]|nr:phage tail tape measure protein [Serratia marcescens]
MSEQTSRLVIMLDSNSAKRSAEGLAGALQRLTTEGEQAEKSTKSLTKVTKEQAQEVAETHRRVEQYRKRLESTKTTISATAKEQDKLTETYFRQIDRVKQLGGGVKELRDIQASLRVERSAGNISQRDYLTLLSHSTGRIKDFTQAEQKSAAEKAKFINLLKRQVAAQHLTNEEMLRARAAQLGVSSSAEIYISKLKAAKVATHGFSLETRSARQELGVMAGELLRGNFGALRGSSITLANRSGLLEQLMSPRLLAAGGVLGGIAAAMGAVYTVVDAADQQTQKFNLALITTGNVSGQTRENLQNLAQSVGKSTGNYDAAAEALTRMAGKGISASVDYRKASEAIVNYSRQTGDSIESLVDKFAQLADDPRGGSEALNKTYHYLTTATYQQITALEEQGRKTDAVRLATDALSGAMDKRANEIKQNLGTLPKLFQEIANHARTMWDAVFALGRDDTTDERLKKAQLSLDSAKNRIATDERNGKKSDDKYYKLVAAKTAEIALIKSTTQARENEQKVQDEGISSQKYLNDLLAKSKTQRELEAAEVKKLNEELEKNRKAHEKDAKVRLYSEAEIAKMRKAITKQFAEPKGASGKGATGGYREDAGRRMIAQLEQQNALLAAQGNTKEKLLASEQELVKWQQQLKVLDKKPAAQLTADEKALLLHRQKITQLIQENVEQEKLTRSLAEYTEREAYRQRLFDAVDNREQSYLSMAQDADRGDKYRQRQQERLSLDKFYIGERAKLDRDYADKSKAMSRETYEFKSQALTEALARDKASLEQSYRSIDALSLNFGAGLSRGLENWLDSASNVYSASQSLAENTFNGMSDALTDFVVSGKDSFGDFAESVLKDLTRMITRMLLFKAIESGMSAFGFGAAGAGAGAKAASSSNAFSSGAYNNLAFWHGGLVGYANGGWVYDLADRMPKAPSFAAGGYTGAGGKYEPRGIVHGGEFVIPKEDTRRIGVDNLEAMLNGNSAVAQYRRPLDMSSGYGQQLAKAMAEDSRPNITINITQNITTSGSGGGMDAKAFEQIKMEIYKAAKQAIEAAYAKVYKDVATNGPIRRTLGV